MVEKLYGVLHGGTTLLSEIEVNPSNELFETLATLPKGARVGVECSPEFFNQSGKERLDQYNAEIPNLYYWEEVIDICNGLDLDVVFLEDFDAYMKTVEKLAELYKNSNGADRNPRVVYRLETEFQYLFEIERERRIFDALAENNPEVAIIGQGHANYLLAHPEEIKGRGISISQILFEELDVDPNILMLVPHALTRVDNNPDIEKKDLLERESLMRRYRAITEGRITEGTKPAYVGTWDLYIPEQGLFELFVNKKEGDQAEGVIEDILGTATFTGSLNDEDIIFRKEYVYDQSLDVVGPGGIIYIGHKRNGRFEGEYETGGNTGKFTLAKDASLALS